MTEFKPDADSLTGDVVQEYEDHTWGRFVLVVDAVNWWRTNDA